jgi:hypothetical protein
MEKSSLSTSTCHSVTMGWLSSIWGTDRTDDPLGKLDPKLREFLEKESPVKYPAASQPTQPSPAPTSVPTPDTQKPANEAPTAANKPAVPSQSLYQDGRYAHLWSTYKPLSQIESENATDSDRLQGVLDAFKARKAAIGRASMENCAIEQEEWINCMKNGSWEDQLQMCKHQVRRFERCYTMQSVRCTSRALPCVFTDPDHSDSFEHSATPPSRAAPWK